MSPTLCRFIPMLLLLALTGCSSTQRPVFTATAIDTSASGTDGIELLITVLATNQNPDPMPLQSVRYDLRLNGTTVFSGVRSPEATIPAFGEQSFSLPAVIPAEWVPSDTKAAEYQIIGSVSYMEPGRFNEILFDRNLRVPKASLRVGGTITFE